MKTSRALPKPQRIALHHKLASLISNHFKSLLGPEIESRRGEYAEAVATVAVESLLDVLAYSAVGMVSTGVDQEGFIRVTCNMLEQQMRSRFADKVRKESLS